MDESGKAQQGRQSRKQHGTHTSLAFPRGETGMGRSPLGDLGGNQDEPTKQGPDLSVRPLQCQQIGI